MANLPAICVCTAAARENVNKVWEAMGRGPGTFSRKLTDDPNATTESPATHYLMSDASASDEDVAEWQAMANGDLPDIGINVWGQDGIIDAAAAQEAISGANLQVYSASGDVIPTEHAAGILASRGLRFVPDPEF